MRSEFYPGFVLKKANTPVLGDAGTDTSSTSDIAFSGAIRLLRAREVRIGGKDSTLATHRIYSEASVNIEESDTITFGGKTYYVIVSDNVMGRNDLRQTDVELRV